MDGEGRLKVIPNGYDEEDFAQLPPYRSLEGERPLHLVHAGILYPSGRSPMPFFAALANLKDSGFLGTHDIRVTLRASGSEALYGAELERLGLQAIVTLAPMLPYRDALAEQSQADALLLFQGDQYDNQIPAKLYEYLRLARPIFALVGARGDTAMILRENESAALVSIDDVQAIQIGLMQFIVSLRADRAVCTSRDAALKYSRREGALLLGKLLDQMTLRPA